MATADNEKLRSRNTRTRPVQQNTENYVRQIENYFHHHNCKNYVRCHEIYLFLCFVLVVELSQVTAVEWTFWSWKT